MVNDIPDLYDRQLSKVWDDMINGATTVSKTDDGPSIQSVAAPPIEIKICTKQIQNDTGANRAVTNNKNILQNYFDIEP